MVALPTDAEISPALEAALDQLARVARDDPAARDALYGVFELKIRRFLLPLRSRFAPLGEATDLDQEGYLCFVQLLADWTGEGTFPAYFLGFMRWRLRHKVEWYERRVRRLVPLREEFVSQGGGDGDAGRAA